MSPISFQSEHPSELDLFPGSSHDKVANAMCSYIIDERNSRVVGLDGEFGSGKSSILTMLKKKLDKITSQKYKVWFFDCEQNYQGSIKSNFIELFTEELMITVGSDEKTKELLRDNRDKALGRHFTYTKNTVSRISSWALLLIVSLFFCTTSFKELFALSKIKDPIALWLYGIHVISFFSPLFVLVLAWLNLKGTMVGEQHWSIFHLFKGGSDDTVTEKIKVAKEVTPLDLKRTLDADLKLLKKLHYVVILDNLDRLPKDSLRTVWSDLEIFTNASMDNNLTVIVPFCSNRVAKYLAADKESAYDSRDFIAKKFPVVFRAPPIITAGWKDGFYKLWDSTFSSERRESAEKCAVLLQRHSPMANKLVTPRLQKRFINDIATTSLTLGPDLDLVCIGTHLLLCKYNDLPLEELLRSDGVSDTYLKHHDSFNTADLKLTQHLLDTHIGSGLESGWQIQVIQIHFLTNSKIAMAELIDEPLAESVRELDSERFASLVSVFGFKDAFKRYLAMETYNSNLIRVLGGASERLSHDEFTSVVSMLNKENKSFQGDIGDDENDFYNTLKTCRLAGLRTGGMDRLKKEIAKAVKEEVNEAVEENLLEDSQERLKRYDLLLDALDATPDIINVNNASYFIHVFAESKDLKVISVQNFKFTQTGTKSIYEHITSLSDSTEILPISEAQREFLLNTLISISSRKFGQDPIVAMTNTEISSLASNLAFYPNDDAILFGLVLSGKTDKTIISQVINQPYEGRTVSQNAAVAALLMSSKNFKDLERIENLETIVESKVFKLLFRAAAYSDVLTSSLNEPNIKGVLGKVFAWAIKDKAIFKLNYSQVSNNFTKITSAIESYGVDEQSLFEWFNGWQSYLKADFESLDSLDIGFVRKLVSSSDNQFPVLKGSAFNYYSSNESSEEDWKSILLSESQNHCVLIQHLSKQKDFRLGIAYRPAVIGVIKNIVSGDLDGDIRSNFARVMTTLIATCNQEQQNLLGAELRNLAYSEKSSPEPVIWLLESFGHLIVDIQPANTYEVGKLMGILEYVGSHPQTSEKICSFLDERAHQISKYTYSKELREAMAVSIAGLVKLAPKLYKSFDKKAYFKRAFKEILSPSRGKIENQMEADK